MQQVKTERPASAAHTALADALITAPEHVPAETRRRLDLFTRPYWSAVDQG
ncbi:MAG: S-methyl-5'-thioadenosine phosphorylase, partial [Synechococcus sp.]|nr:S-methyl-5'-thioadenosine phosphorylase [Synechococcus sp.]